MRVNIPDDILDAYQLHADKSGLPLEQVLAQQLRKFRQVAPKTRVVVLTGDALDTVEQVLAGGSVSSGADLANKVTRLAGIRFHEIRLDFTPGQLDELAYRAERQGRPVKDLVAEIVRGITEQFFWTTAGGQAGDGYEAPKPSPPAVASAAS